MTGSEPKRLQLANVDLAYDDVGTGLPPILLLHGFSCGRMDFVHQFAHFSERHRVVAFDPDQVNAMTGRFLASVDAGFPKAAASPW